VERGDISPLRFSCSAEREVASRIAKLFARVELGKHPDSSNHRASYAARIAGDFGRKVRNLGAGAPRIRRLFRKITSRPIEPVGIGFLD